MDLEEYIMDNNLQAWLHERSNLKEFWEHVAFAERGYQHIKDNHPQSWLCERSDRELMLDWFRFARCGSYPGPRRPYDAIVIKRVSQEAKRCRRRDQIRLDVLITLRRTLPEDLTNLILKPSLCEINLKGCPDKLIAVDPRAQKLVKLPVQFTKYKSRSLRHEAITCSKHKGR